MREVRILQIFAAVLIVANIWVFISKMNDAGYSPLMIAVSLLGIGGFIFGCAMIAITVTNGLFRLSGRKSTLSDDFGMFFRSIGLMK